MVDMRCPSQFEKCFSMEKGNLLMMSGLQHGRHLLDDLILDEDEVSFFTKSFDHCLSFKLLTALYNKHLAKSHWEFAL
jgi:hypothetical protein